MLYKKSVNDWSLEKTVNFGSPGISYRVKCPCWPWSFPIQYFDKKDDKNKTSYQNQVWKNDAFWPSWNFIPDFVGEDWSRVTTILMFCNWHRGVMWRPPSNGVLLLCYATHLLRIFPPFFPLFCVISRDREVPKITTKLLKLYSTPGFLNTRFMVELGSRFYRYQ